MPIFNSNNKRVFIELVTADGQNQDPNVTQGTTDYTANDQNNGETTDYTAQTDAPVEPAAPAGNPGDPGATNIPTTNAGGEETTDYTNEPTDGDVEEGEAVPEEGTEEGDPNAGVEEKTPDEIKQLEDELFASLSPEQLAIKNLELKNLYIELYSIVDNLITKINDLPKNSKFISIVEFISDNLSELKSMLIDYLNNGTYASLSYTENSINYNKFVAVLQGINKMIEEIKIDESEEN